MSREGLSAMVAAFGTAAACVAATYAHPALAGLRPWNPGEPLPVVASLVPREAARVVEDASGALVSVEDAGTDGERLGGGLGDGLADGGGGDAGDGLADEGTAGATPGAGRLPARPPGVATPLVDGDHRGMDPFYRALHRAAAGEGVARASQWGDSTIAADGITSTVRARLQARFGDGGPGYLSAGMDPRWNERADVGADRKGEWSTVSLLEGGGGGRYGFGGIVSTAAAESYLALSAPKAEDGTRTRLRHLEVWYQAGPERGQWWASADGKGVGSGNALAEGTGDRWHVVDVPQGFTRAAIGATGGPVPFYGVVLETGEPGVVWDALGVVGVGSRSFTMHGKRHLAQQVERRDPDLVVVMLGGNEVGWPVLSQGTGAGYAPYFTDAVRRLRAGAPESGCLVITPLDQGTREGGSARTKPNLSKLVEVQRQVAEAEGCAFWNAWAAMGGSGSIARWSTLRPPLAWTDLAHISAAGQAIVGDLLADAVFAGYDAWVAAGGPSRPVPAPPGPASGTATP